MNEFKGTPGIWEVETVESDGEVTEIYILEEDGSCILCINNGDDAYDIPTDLANAHLIAAAPELLEKLQFMLYVFDRNLTIGSIQYRTCQQAKETILKALKNSNK